ncbi:uncharacterized protein LOC143905563 [Temnothorax americanus]|uniref:uncharacterized protein LOC143905563 n=1 Tax=Temnothorax americanus TaxID=1964332 RepID=UPI0040690877
MPDPAKTATDGKTLPLLDLPEERRVSDRQASPVRLSAELTLKVQTQMNRIPTVWNISETLPSSADLQMTHQWMRSYRSRFNSKRCTRAAVWSSGRAPDSIVI